MDYQPPTPAPAREHIIGEDEDEAPSSKDPSSSNHSNPNLPSNRPHQPAQHPHRPSTNTSRPGPTPPKPVTHPSSRPGVGGGHPAKIPPPPLSTWGAPPASMAPPSGPMGRGGGGNVGQQATSKGHPKPPGGRSNKAALPPLDVTLDRKKSLNNQPSLDVSTYLCFKRWFGTGCLFN